MPILPSDTPPTKASMPVRFVVVQVKAVAP